MSLQVLRTTGGPSHEIAGEMAEKIKDVIYEYSDRVPVALAIGVLEIVKTEVMGEQR